MADVTEGRKVADAADLLLTDSVAPQPAPINAARQRRRRERAFLAAADAVLILVAFAIAYWMRYQITWPAPFNRIVQEVLTVNSVPFYRLLPRVCKGDLILTWALSERDPRALPEAIHTEAKADGDHFVLNGTKMFVENFNVAEKCLVACRTGGSGSDGISVFLVDTNAPGITRTDLLTLAKDKQAKVEFNGVRVPKANLVGDLNQGWSTAEAMFDRAVVLQCAQHIGAARRQAEMGIEYAKTRVAFGRPIGAFQAIAHLCADQTIWIDGGQLLTYEALWRMDQGLPASVEVSQAKAFCNDKFMISGWGANQIHGGVGFIDEFDLSLWFRRVAAMCMKLGTTYEHRARVAAALLDQPGKVQLGESMYELLPVG